MSPGKFLSAAAAAALLLAGAAATFDQADARGRRGHATIHTQRGDAHAQSQVRRGRGFRTRDASVTGPGGRTRGVSDSRTWDRAQGTYNHDRTTTFRDGSARVVDTDVQRTGPGAFTAQRQVTGRSGQTRTQTGDFTVERTGDGRVVTGDIQTSNVGQIDYTRQVSRGGGARSVSASATFDDGSSITRASSASCDGAGTCSGAGSVTNRRGGTTSWQGSRTRDGNDLTRARTITYPDGTTRTVDYARDGSGDGSGSFERTVTGRDGRTRTQTGEYWFERR